MANNKKLKLEMTVDDFSLLHEMLCKLSSAIENEKMPMICHKAFSEQYEFKKKLNVFTEKVYALIEWERTK